MEKKLKVTYGGSLTLGVEVGVFAGATAKSLVERVPSLRYTGVDSYATVPTLLLEHVRKVKVCSIPVVFHGEASISQDRSAAC